MPQSLDRLVACLKTWSALPHHWVVLSGDRRTGKSSLLHALGEAAFAQDNPFVLWELPERDAGGPWALVDDPAPLILLDDWPLSHIAARPTGPLPGHGLIAVPQHDATMWPAMHWPFAPTDAVVWVTLRRPMRNGHFEPTDPFHWRATGAAHAQGVYRLPFPTYRLAPLFRIWGARSSTVYAYPACVDKMIGPDLQPVWTGI